MSACNLCKNVRFVVSPITGAPSRCPCAKGHAIALLELRALPEGTGRVCHCCGKRSALAGGLGVMRRSWLADGTMADGHGYAGSVEALSGPAFELCARCVGFVLQGAGNVVSQAKAGRGLAPFVASCGLLDVC